MSVTNAHEFFIQWHLTERCNLRCTHCYQTGGRTEELTLGEIKVVLEEFEDTLKIWSEAYDISFSPSFNITGGEPLLRRDIFEIIETIGRRGFDIYLLSNGTLMSREKAAVLAGLGVRGVQVSMEGPEEIHDSIRGKGAFAEAANGIGNLLAAGLKVTINATLSEVNSGDFLSLPELAGALGVQKLGFSRLVPSGRGSGLLDKMIGRGKVKEIYEKIFSSKTEGLEIVTGDPVASQMSCAAGGGSVATGGCAAGISGLTFLPDGTIVPCRRLFVPIGNIREDRIREVWATSPVLEALRDKGRYKGKCGRCVRWSGCRGCRAIAYAYSIAKGDDDFLAEDPQCFIGEEI
jgi:radical SAM protein with 4Fe4S-binding SPASM domain